MSYLFIKKSVSKRKVCIIFIKNLKFKTTQKNKKKTFLVGFFVGFFGWFFWVGFLLPTLHLGGVGGRHLLARRLLQVVKGAGPRPFPNVEDRADEATPQLLVVTAEDPQREVLRLPRVQEQVVEGGLAHRLPGEAVDALRQLGIHTPEFGRHVGLQLPQGLPVACHRGDVLEGVGHGRRVAAVQLDAGHRPAQPQLLQPQQVGALSGRGDGTWRRLAIPRQVATNRRHGEVRQRACTQQQVFLVIKQADRK